MGYHFFNQRPGAVAGVKKTAGTAQGGKGVTGGAQQAVRGPSVGRKPGVGGASKGRGSSNEKGIFVHYIFCFFFFVFT